MVIIIIIILFKIATIFYCTLIDILYANLWSISDIILSSPYGTISITLTYQYNTYCYAQIYFITADIQEAGSKNRLQEVDDYTNVGVDLCVQMTWSF